MKKIIFPLMIVSLFFLNCNDSGGWSAAEKQKGIKDCMGGMAGVVEEGMAKQICNCVLDKFMKKYKSYDEADKMGSETEAQEAGRQCATEIQQGGGGKKGGVFGGGDDNGGKKGGIFGGGGGNWSATDKNTFSTQCQQGLAQNGYSQNQARQLCDCILGKIQKKYSSLKEADEKGGANAGAQARMECEGGNMNDGDDENNNDNDNYDNE